MGRPKKSVDLIPALDADPKLVAEVDDIINLGLKELRSMIRDGSADVKTNAIKSLMPLINRKLDPERDKEGEEMIAMKAAMAEILSEIRK